MSAVEGCLVLRGMTKEQAVVLIRGYKLKERLDALPDVAIMQMVKVTRNTYYKYKKELLEGESE